MYKLRDVQSVAQCAAIPGAVGCNPQPIPLALYAECGTIWFRISLHPVGISCPGSGCAPSQLLVPSSPGTARAEKPLV